MMNVSTKKTANFVKIDKDKAEKYLSQVYDNQRPLDAKHVNFLANAMESSLFDPTSTIAFAAIGENEYLIDGQHTLAAILKSGISQTLLVSKYFVSNFSDIARLYSHFNIGKGRTFFDSIRAYNVTENTGLKNTQINKVAAAIRYQMAGFPKNKASIKLQHEDMIKKVISWQDQGLLFFNAINFASPMVKRRMQSAPILSVCLVILKYCPVKGVEFVNLANDDGLKKGDPRKAFLNYLMETSQDSLTVKRKQTSGHIARSTAKCWGKYYNDLSLTHVRIKNLDAVKNIVIKGTPYTGKFPTVG